ncbi:MAG: beta-lactamase family protein [Rhodospirillaceae bacterium]|nr:beta-lactamase family protein [Rhodospirillaceae bacterium]
MIQIADLSADEITRFSGVVSIAPLEGGPALELAFGLANRGHRVPNNIGTRFAMASGCKIFTAMAVGSLIQDGKLTLDTRLADCVRSRPLHFGSAVTIGQLLNHTSGIPDYCNEELGDDYAALWRERPCYRMTSVRDFLPLFENAPMKAQPGQGFLYCNAGFVLLGLVIEELTGRDFREIVAERIFGPCGMTHSGYFAMDALPDNTALGYLSEDETDRRTNIYSVPLIGGGDGGAFTTAEDMRLFWTALLAGRLLERDLLDRFLAPSVRMGERGDFWHYGRGVYLRQERGSWIVSVEGCDPGASMESQVSPRVGVILTVLSNTTDGAVRINEILAARLSAA